MSLEPIHRTHCVVDHSQWLTPLFTFREFPVWMGCTDAPPEQDLRQDMRWVICEDCGTIQLDRLIPLDVLYAHSHNSGVVGGLWARHHQAFAEFVLAQAPATVLEIGGGHGMLSMHAHAQRPEIDWTILEPNPTPRPECKARYLKGFFDEHFRFDRPVDTVVHSHFFEHLYQPALFLRQLQQFLPLGGKQVFSLPNLPVMLQRQYTNCLNFEHTFFVDETMLEALLARNGFKVLAKQYFLDDHSIFYATERAELPAPPLPNAVAANRALYQRYVEHHHQLIAELNRRIASHDGPVYLFGAHVFAQYLFAFGLDASRIELILDNDAMKQGKRLTGSRINIASPKVLAGVDNALLILKAGVYNEEIRRDIVDNINPGVQFV